MQEQLGQLRDAVTSVDELRLMLENPEVDSRVKEDVLAKIAAGADESVVNFVKLLAEKGRAAELGEVSDGSPTRARRGRAAHPRRAG